MSPRFQPGQRWTSEAEPELGLGIVHELTAQTVVIRFPAAGETRQYSLENAPIRRVRFQAGDSVRIQDGRTLGVGRVVDRNGVIFYICGAETLPESELDDQTSFNGPQDRLRNEQVDSSELFDLRLVGLQHQHRRRESEARGFAGARMELIPHQLSIAAEVSGRLIPRVLLADEVGLGKTIEACLIVHRLLQTGRVARVLILVPEPLVHQWFVELLRRFNLWYHIFDEERCAAIERTDPEVNPFLDDQLVLCPIPWLAANERRAAQAVAAGWDVLVVDEAHHLGWTPESPTREYALVEALANRTPGLLLLTATPEQLGLASHFARLRLLDPERYYDLAAFVRETEHYRVTARIADTLLSTRPLSPVEVSTLTQLPGRPAEIITAQLAAIASGDDRARADLIEDLVDQHGTGRVMFRNTRSTVRGFPKRTPTLHPLPPRPEDEELLDRLAAEFASDTGTAGSTNWRPEYDDDPRIPWLAALLRQLESQKVLLICRSRAKVDAIDEALRAELQVNTALFHEDLPLLQRDRNAAWFAEEDGARILLASEIGSEGRNFQFAHHLVLFDVPLDPELLEQRIGRLDRIGQASEISIHVPFVTGSSQEILARWVHEGLNALEKNLRGGHQLLERFRGRVLDLAQDYHETRNTAELEDLINDTRAAALALGDELEHGRDRLLELNSFRPKTAARILAAIQAADDDPALESFMLRVFDRFHIHLEVIAPRTYRLGSAGVFADAFPGLRPEGLTVTLDRRRALTREDYHFLTWDHPLATSALDLLLGGPDGNSSFAIWPDPRTQAIYLEAVYLLECVSPAKLHADRFLAPQPIRVVVDHSGNDAENVARPEVLRRHLKPGAPALLHVAEIRDELLPGLLKQADALAAAKSPALITQSRHRLKSALDHEIARLRELQQVNRNVRERDIELLVEHQRALDGHLRASRLRLDAIRVIQRGPI